MKNGFSTFLEENKLSFRQEHIYDPSNKVTSSGKQNKVLHIGSSTVTLRNIKLPLNSNLDFTKLDCSYCTIVYFDKTCNMESLHGIEKFITKLSTQRKGGDFANGAWGKLVFNTLVTRDILGLFLISGIREVLMRTSLGKVKEAKLEEIFERHLQKGKDGIIDAQHEMIEAGLDEFAKI